MERAELWQREDKGIPSWTDWIWLDEQFLHFFFVLYLMVLTKTELLMRLVG